MILIKNAIPIILYTKFKFRRSVKNFANVNMTIILPISDGWKWNDPNLIQRAEPLTGSKKYVIVEGRDIGTVIFPNADYKIFMWASSYIRAQRRVAQIAETKKKPNITQIHKSIKARDIRDMTRKTAPLIPAADSYLICTDFSDKEVTFNTIIKIIKGKK